MKLKDMTGMRIGKLMVLKRIDDTIGANYVKHSTYLCECDCGKIVPVVGRYLKRKSIVERSCSSCNGRIGMTYKTKHSVV